MIDSWDWCPSWLGRNECVYPFEQSPFPLIWIEYVSVKFLLNYDGVEEERVEEERVGFVVMLWQEFISAINSHDHTRKFHILDSSSLRFGTLAHTRKSSRKSATSTPGRKGMSSLAIKFQWCRLTGKKWDYRASSPLMSESRLQVMPTEIWARCSATVYVLWRTLHLSFSSTLSTLHSNSRTTSSQSSCNKLALPSSLSQCPKCPKYPRFFDEHRLMLSSSRSTCSQCPKCPKYPQTYRQATNPTMPMSTSHWTFIH